MSGMGRKQTLAIPVFPNSTVADVRESFCSVYRSRMVKPPTADLRHCSDYGKIIGPQARAGGSFARHRAERQIAITRMSAS